MRTACRGGSVRPPVEDASHPSARALEGAGPLRPEDSARRIVVHEPSEDRLALLQPALLECGLVARWVPDAAALAVLRAEDDSGLALVSAAVPPATGPAVPAAVASLKRSRYTVVCYGAGLPTWPLGEQCRLLLAGAAALVDSATPRFAGELAGHLGRFLALKNERQRAERRLQRQMRALGLVGIGPAICDVFRWIQRVGPLSDLPVRLEGETGTGKELVARAIHRLDPRRRAGPFVAVNCAAIGPGLAESELFGHRRGAFTGADHDRKGWVRAAAGGVLFLDEIGDLELPLQGKLLRVLQERRVLPVGEDREAPVNVRVIAATNRDLRVLVERGAFRADLLHRLDVLSLRLPPLRERPEDVAALVDHVLARASGASAPGVTAEFLRALRDVALPGNVRQLENLVRRALATADHPGPLRLSDLTPELWSELAHREAVEPGEAAASGSQDAAPALGDAVEVLRASNWRLEQAVAFCEGKIVAAALGASSGNRSRAARLLGISPRSIFNKIRKHNLGA